MRLDKIMIPYVTELLLALVIQFALEKDNLGPDWINEDFAAKIWEL